MKELFEYLRQEWKTVSAAPFTFAILAGLAVGLGYRAARWYYLRTIEHLRGESAGKTERLAVKDLQLDQYRQSSNQSSTVGSAFTNRSDKELQTEALGFVTSLRQWIQAWEKQESERTQKRWLEMTQAKDDTAKQALWEVQRGEDLSSSLTRNHEYETKFKVRAIVLRDELLSRVKAKNRTADAICAYEHPTNPFGMRTVADDIEQMARLLG